MATSFAVQPFTSQAANCVARTKRTLVAGVRPAHQRAHGVTLQHQQPQQQWKLAMSTPVRSRVHVIAQASESPSDGDSHEGHAFLHDFCMCIPYGVISLGASLALLLLGAATKPLALPTAAAGAVNLGCSVLSLKTWRAGGQNAALTLLAGGSAGAAAYLAYGQMQEGAAPLLTGGIAALSAALAVFCMYNVIAGGNPPRKGTKGY